MHTHIHMFMLIISTPLDLHALTTLTIFENSYLMVDLARKRTKMPLPPSPSQSPLYRSHVDWRSVEGVYGERAGSGRGR